MTDNYTKFKDNSRKKIEKYNIPQIDLHYCKLFIGQNSKSDNTKKKVLLYMNIKVNE